MFVYIKRTVRRQYDDIIRYWKYDCYGVDFINCILIIVCFILDVSHCQYV